MPDEHIKLNPTVAIAATGILSLLQRAGAEELELTTRYNSTESREANVHADMSHYGVSLHFSVNEEYVEMDLCLQSQTTTDQQVAEGLEAENLGEVFNRAIGVLENLLEHLEPVLENRVLAPETARGLPACPPADKKEAPVLDLIKED
jgi:hypothetical protein